MKIFRDWTFKWWQVSLLKVGLVSFGIILGASFYAYVSQVMWLWWALFVVTALYFIVRFFKDDAQA